MGPSSRRHLRFGDRRWRVLDGSTWVSKNFKKSSTSENRTTSLSQSVDASISAASFSIRRWWMACRMAPQRSGVIVSVIVRCEIVCGNYSTGTRTFIIPKCWICYAAEGIESTILARED